MPTGALGRGLFLGSSVPLEGQLLEMPLSWSGGKCRAAPPACPGFPGLSGHLLLGEVLLHPSIHPPAHPVLPQAPRQPGLAAAAGEAAGRDGAALPLLPAPGPAPVPGGEVGAPGEGSMRSPVRAPTFLQLSVGGRVSLGPSRRGASPHQDGQVHLVTLLDETTTAECRQEVAINLVKLFLGQGLVKEFLDLLFELELAKPCKAGAGSGAGGFQPSPGAAKPPGPSVVIFWGGDG